MNNSPSLPQREFVFTKEHKRFVEFCAACQQYRYIGLCYGYAGVGKTLSARQYTCWDSIESHLVYPAFRQPLPSAITACRSVFYTPPVVSTPRLLENEITATCRRLNALVAEANHLEVEVVDFQHAWQPADYVELLIIDEADWLRMSALEQVRAIYDQRQIGLILIGMPGLEKRLARYPQLYSRVGFVHHFHPLSIEETQFVLQHKWSQAIVGLEQAEFANQEAVSAIIRVTGGNFRLLERLLSQITRILVINRLELVTKEVVDAARESLVIGAQ
jgi:DNA transposition AAA+ family ATPase